MTDTEVLIVGGGPAGAACAWTLRRYGIDCLVLDSAPFPRVKPCAGWISPGVFSDLALNPAYYPYGLTRLSAVQLSVRGLKLRVPARLTAIRRIEFDDFLLRRANVRVLTHHVRDIVQTDGGYVVDGAFSAHYLVGAGGTHCPVARTFFAEANPRPPEDLIVTQEEEFRCEVANPTETHTCHLWFFEDGLPGYAWYLPKAEGYINVGVGGGAEALKARGDTIRHHWDLLVERLETQGLVRGHTYEPKGHAYYLRRRRGKVRIGDAFVAGDAAGLATSDMGEGIAPAIRSGIQAAEAIATGGSYALKAVRRWSQPWPIAALISLGYGR